MWPHWVLRPFHIIAACARMALGSGFFMYCHDQQIFAPCSAKILCHEVDLMQDHSVQQSVAETCSKVLLFTL